MECGTKYGETMYPTSVQINKTRNNDPKMIKEVRNIFFLEPSGKWLKTINKMKEIIGSIKAKITGIIKMILLSK